MNAAEARKLTEAALSKEGEAVGPLIKLVMEKITNAAKLGEKSLRDPLKGLRTNVSALQKQAIYDHLKSEGYEVKDDRDRDGSSLITISWCKDAH